MGAMSTEYATEPTNVDISWLTEPPPRRVRGLRFPSFAGTAVAQVLGGVAALAGTYVQWGIGVTLIAGGVAAVVLGMLREAGKV